MGEGSRAHPEIESPWPPGACQLLYAEVGQREAKAESETQQEL